jgi:hypothetical protein
MKIFLLLFLIAATARAAEDIEEAQGLEDEPAAVASQVRDENFRHRSYLLGEGLSQKRGSQGINDYAQFEASLGLNYDAGSLKFFFDGVADHQTPNQNTAFLNQIGLRYQPSDAFSFAVGKERNRRSPGIIVSPSDFIFSQNSLPGQREDRRGVWLGRASYQVAKTSYDLFLLPVASLDTGGWPTRQSQYSGTAVRAFQQYDNLDVSVMAGNIDSVFKAGVALQGFVSKVWKTYYEIGYAAKYLSALGQESQQVTQHLVGLSYEGSEDYSVKGELYFNGQGFNAAEFESFKVIAAGSAPTSLSVSSLFIRKQYGLVTFSALEIKNHYNFFISLIKSFDDQGFVSLLRAERLMSDHLVIGAGGLFINGGQNSQYFLATFDQQYSVDVKYTF